MIQTHIHARAPEGRRQMALTWRDIMLGVIAAALCLIFLFGIDVVG